MKPEFCKTENLKKCIQNKDRVLIISIEWEKSEKDVRTKLNDLFNSGTILYTKVCFFEKAANDTFSSAHLILRFCKTKSIIQILKYFPHATVKKINSWKNQKELMTRTVKDTDNCKIFEIGNDCVSKQYTKSQHHEKRRSTKTYEKASKSSNQSLYDIVKLKKLMDVDVSNTAQDLTSVVYNERPDLLRARNEGLKLANELCQNERMKCMRKKAETTKWRQWQKWFIDKATNQHINSREVMVVYDPNGNTGKSYLRKMFGILHPNQTCKLQNGHSQNMFHSAGKIDDLRYVLMDLARSDSAHVNYGAVEQIKNGDFDTCKYNNINVCFEPPFFTIFTNFKLDWYSLSLDRWSLLYINKDNSFKYYERFDQTMKQYFNQTQKWTLNM